jgi:hypothetical protein
MVERSREMEGRHNEEIRRKEEEYRIVIMELKDTREVRFIE